MAPESVVVGRFNGPWGVKGWVKVYSETRPTTRIFEYQPWLVAERGEPLELEQWQQSGARLVAKLRGIDSPEAAAALGRAIIRVPRSALPEPEAGEYYWHDLIGLDVINLEGHDYGRVHGLIETGAHDVLDVRSEAGSVLIPFVSETFVRAVDLDAGRITVDWPVEWTGED